MAAMDDSVFENYFERCVWRGADKVPSYHDLREMEEECLDRLFELKRQDYQQYKVLFALYGEKDISRITYCHQRLNGGMEANDEFKMRGLLASYVRFLKSLKALDRSLYEKKLRGAIQRGKRNSREVKKQVKEQEPVTINKTPFFKKIVLEREKIIPLYDALVGERWLDASTSPDVFIYYFTGEGKEPDKKMRWVGKKTILSILLNQIESEPEWVVAGEVFEKVSAKSLRTMSSSTYQDKQADAYYEHSKKVTALTRSL